MPKQQRPSNIEMAGLIAASLCVLGLVLVLGYSVRHYPSWTDREFKGIEENRPTPAWLWIAGVAIGSVGGLLFSGTLYLTQRGMGNSGSEPDPRLIVAIIATPVLIGVLLTALA